MAKPTNKTSADKTAVTSKAAPDRKALIAQSLITADDGFIDVVPDALDQFDEISGGYDGPTWAPHLSDDFSPYSAKITRENLSKISQPITRDRLCGRLTIQEAFGESRYFLTAKRNGDDIAILLPAHIGLYNRLDKCNLDAVVSVVCEGRHDAGRNGKQAAFIYAVHQLTERFSEERAKLADVIKEAAEAKRAGNGDDNANNGDDDDVNML